MAKNRRLYYTMGQVCEMFDLPPSTIRFWEKRFKAIAPRKNAKGNRLFTPTDVENLKLIYHLVKEKKMTLSGAETYMMQRKAAAKGEMSMVEILQKIRATLVEIRQEIETAEQVHKEQDDIQIVIKSEQIDELQAIEVEYKPQTFNATPKTENGEQKIDNNSEPYENNEQTTAEEHFTRFEQLSLF